MKEIEMRICPTTEDTQEQVSRRLSSAWIRLKNRCFLAMAILCIVSSCKRTEEVKDSVLTPISAKEDRGVGPVKVWNSVPVDRVRASRGKTRFQSQCVACHRLHSQQIGPALGDVTLRRRPEWILNMILDPEAMLAGNLAARRLLRIYNIRMPPQGITKAQALDLLDYLRSIVPAKTKPKKEGPRSQPSVR